MKKIFTSVILLAFIWVNSNAQIPDWSTRIASIIYNNCSSCHHAGGIAPFALMNYSDVNGAAAAVLDAVTQHRMPPWPADPSYMHFTNEAVLEQSEIDDITTWINNGMPQGNLALAPDAPVYDVSGSVLDTIDYTVQIAPYTLQYNTDEYRFFAMHTNFSDTVYVSKIEVIAGLPEVIHHADIYYDLSGQTFITDQLDPLSGFNNATGTMNTDKYMNAWQPGGNVVEYPHGWGIMVPPGADFVFEIHYGPGHIGETDTTKMNLQFIPADEVERQVHVGWLMNTPINGPLMIPADSVKVFNQVTAPLGNDLSVISICPHMHHIGVSYRVWYEDATGDSIPLIDIPEWDFHWQKYYTYQYVNHIPAGSTLRSEGVYDNTVNNLDNPNNPPVNVYSGPYTTNEMFLCYFIYAYYQPGDENILLDSSLLISSVEYEIDFSFDVFPNPVSNELMVNCYNQNLHSISITDVLGRNVFIQKENLNETNSLDVHELASGIYFITVKTVDGKASCKKLMKL